MPGRAGPVLVYDEESGGAGQHEKGAGYPGEMFSGEDPFFQYSLHTLQYR
jgi:hypothetical protein